MLIRANCLARGHSAVRPELVELLVACLSADILPRIPERGSVGASGDLVPLSYIARLLNGDGDVHVAGGGTGTAEEALKEAGLTPVVLEAKEGLALLNGTSFMSGFAALAVHGAQQIAFADRPVHRPDQPAAARQSRPLRGLPLRPETPHRNPRRCRPPSRTHQRLRRLRRRGRRR